MAAPTSCFVDTNVLLYSVDPSDARKQDLAWRWLEVLWSQQAGRLSWQVLHEFYVNAVRKAPLAVRDARKVVENYVQWQPVETTRGLIERGWHWMDQAQVSYWDSLIVAAAERAGCGWLLSEDFQTGRQFGSVEVVNPFLQGPEEIIPGG